MAKHAWQKIFRNFFTYLRTDRNAIIILSTIIFILILANLIVKNLEPVSKSDFLEIKAIIEEWESDKEEINNEPALSLFDFDPNSISQESLDTLDLPRFIKRNLINYRGAGGKFKSPADVRKIYGMNDSIFALIENHIIIKQKKEPRPKQVAAKEPSGFFDPNKASVTDLKQFGFNNYQANNLLSYRENGGVFQNSTDVLKIYGIDSTFYNRISKYILIESTEIKTLVEPKSEIRIELNSADSTNLIQLNGIGATYATRIIKYRNLLGGYYSKEQLNEIYNFPEETYIEIQSQIYVDTSQIVKLRINFAEFSELISHPYINKNQVKALLDRRETKGPLKSISELHAIKAFDSETIKKISPYITCR